MAQLSDCSSKRGGGGAYAAGSERERDRVGGRGGQSGIEGRTEWDGGRDRVGWKEGQDGGRDRVGSREGQSGIEGGTEWDRERDRVGSREGQGGIEGGTEWDGGRDRVGSREGQSGIEGPTRHRQPLPDRRSVLTMRDHA